MDGLLFGVKNYGFGGLRFLGLRIVVGDSIRWFKV